MRDLLKFGRWASVAVVLLFGIPAVAHGWTERGAPVELAARAARPSAVRHELRVATAPPVIAPPRPIAAPPQSRAEAREFAGSAPKYLLHRALLR